MTTATAPKTARRALRGVTTLPEYDVGKATMAKLDALNDDAHDLAGRIDDWRADMDQLYHTAGGMIVDEAIDRKTELTSERGAIVDAYVDLAWRQFGLVPLLLPFAKANADKAKAHAEKVLADQLESYAAAGIDIHAMPHGDANHEAANHQLQVRAKQEIPVMAASAAAGRAANALRVLQSQNGVPVSTDSCKFTWTPPRGVADHVLRLLGA